MTAMPRRPDGSLADEREMRAAHEWQVARRLMAVCPGWKIEPGPYTHEYVAIHPDHPRLLVAPTPDRMVRQVAGLGFPVRQ